MKRISVLIVEDHMLVREGIRSILSLQTDMEVVGEAQDGRNAVAIATELCPDVILIDIAMPKLNGLEAARQLAKIIPKTRIIILTAHGDDAYVRNAVDCGVAGFLLKQNSGDDICQAIRKVHAGGVFYTTSIAKRFIKINTNVSDSSGKTENKIFQLTSREMEVLQLVAEGKANKESAAELGISTKTVEKHRGQLMKKLDIHDTAGLTRYAIATGIIESSVQITTL